ncbi:MAG: signal peptide peptidase SppA [Pigmentiphaga sp.]|nr:signal peptide peptidase SppA [Pigmentiphaga sp.]
MSREWNDVESDEDVRWERRTLEKLALGTLKEQRAQRRWKIFFRFVYLGLLCLVLVGLAKLFIGSSDAIGPHTAVIRIEGVIEADGETSAERVNAALKGAFDTDEAQAVVLKINSPGGSPVQAGMIYDEIKRLRGLHPDKALYAVIEEIGASGGYYVAAAADRIYVNQASLVGSIGVIMESFGAEALLEKLGVERRLIVSGENKAFMDPFTPLTEAQRELAQALVDDIQRQFVNAVLEGRGERLRQTPGMFSGAVWTGAQSVELGVADDLATLDQVAREVVKAPALIDYTIRDELMERVAKRVGVNVRQGLWRDLLSSASSWR